MTNEQPEQWAWRLLCKIDSARLIPSQGLHDKTAALTIQRAFTERTADLVADNAKMREVLKVADDAIKEMFRYYDGGETRGSYDGKPERAKLRKAGYAASFALAQQDTTDAK